MCGAFNTFMRPRVLIIDDMADVTRVLGEYLSDAYDVRYALGGQQALALAAAIVPDLILLDVTLPDIDGHAVCDALKRVAPMREVPVLFVTARTDAQSESRALAAGAADFIPMPVNRDVVQARVHLHLALRSREHELRELSEELGARVAERTQALRDALVREEAACRAKALFLANVNHELRTPIDAILGLSAALTSQIGDPMARERVERIERAGRQLVRIVDELIDMADLQAGKVRIEQVEFDPAAMLEELESSWRARAEAKGLGWELTRDPALPPRLYGDAGRLKQVLRNLLDNAVKFSEQGRVTCRARVLEPGDDRVTLRLEVEDEGIGIGAERQADIFEAFEQADHPRTRRRGGTGLGLAICKSLTELMGGTIGVRSTLGRGSLFWVVIPFACRATTIASTTCPEDRSEPESLELDLFQFLQIFSPLTHQLAAEDIQAYLLWQRGREILDAALGDRAGDFDAAMKALDFATALRYLREARSAFLALAGAEVDPKA